MLSVEAVCQHVWQRQKTAVRTAGCPLLESSSDPSGPDPVSQLFKNNHCWPKVCPIMKSKRKVCTCTIKVGVLWQPLSQKKNDQGFDLFWSWRGWVAAAQKVPSALLLNPNPGISKRNWFVDLSALAEGWPPTFHLDTWCDCCRFIAQCVGSVFTWWFI